MAEFRTHRTGKAAAGMLLALACSALAAACASGGAYAELDSRLSPCDAQYREYRDQPPAPAGMPEKERGRHQDATRDYHVSKGCQREAERTVGVPVPSLPRPRGG